jgi:hypothetical protein
MIVDPANLETMGESLLCGTSVCGSSAAIDRVAAPPANNANIAD